MKIKDISRISGRTVTTIEPGASLDEAIEKMVTHSIGALPVCESNGKITGIISERDIIRWLYDHRETAKKIKIKNVMTKDIITGTPEDDIEEISEIMYEKGIRHVPVMTGDNLAGMLSIRDIIEEKLSECHTQVQHLHNYIGGGFSR